MPRIRTWNKTRKIVLLSWVDVQPMPVVVEATAMPTPSSVTWGECTTEETCSLTTVGTAAVASEYPSARNDSTTSSKLSGQIPWSIITLGDHGCIE